jgi:hypothetical protein
VFIIFLVIKHKEKFIKEILKREKEKDKVK